MNSSLETCEIECDVLAVTPGAMLIDDGATETWLPMSTIFNDDKFKIERNTTNVTLRVAYWIAKKKGLI